MSNKHQLGHLKSILIAEKMYMRNKEEKEGNIFNFSGKQNKYPLFIHNAPSGRPWQMEHIQHRSAQRVGVRKK